MAENGAKSVSAIGDAEMKGYLNTKKEMMYKKIIWELMNKEHLQPCRNEKNKKSAAAAASKGMKKKRVEKEKEMEEEKKKKQRQSSKINYDVLRKLLEEDDRESGRKAETEKEESFAYGCRDIGEERNEKSIGESEAEEHYSEGNEENEYGNFYYGEEEDEEELGYNFDEDY